MDIQTIASGAKIVGSIAASFGSSKIVSDIVDHVTPETVSTAGKVVRKVAAIGIGSGVGAFAAAGLTKKIDECTSMLEKAKAKYEEFHEEYLEKKEAQKKEYEEQLKEAAEKEAIKVAETE